MRLGFAAELRCPDCSGPLSIEAEQADAASAQEGVLHCRCGRRFPIEGGVPRLLPAQGSAESVHSAASARTSRAFGDEWHRFPAVMPVHERFFHWYFEGEQPVAWHGRRVLDAGCGMGRWLHFARRSGARVVGMDVSAAVDVAAAREGEDADFVQADLRRPPFAEASFDMVYCLGVLHHLEDPLAGVRALARLVRPGGELRIYVYRSLDDEPAWKKALFAAVTLLRRATIRLPYTLVHALAWLIAAAASVVSIWPRRALRRSTVGDQLTRSLPLVHYADVPFSMLVSEQFDRLVAPIERRFRREDIAAWFTAVGFDTAAILPGLGWRAIGRRPLGAPAGPPRAPGMR